jgi:nucleotide-binding universal stress UspA family protein
MKILLPVDGSVYTRRMLAYVAAHDEFLGPAHDYSVLTVVPEIAARTRAFIEPQVLEAFYDEAAKEVLEPVKAFAARCGWRFSAMHVAGLPGDRIAEAAMAGGHDLIVMGSHGHGALGNVVLGSVATRVLARCKTPVLLVR